MSSTRANCDERFFENMKLLCHQKFDNKKISVGEKRPVKRSMRAWEKLVEALKGSAAIGQDFWDWAQETSGTLEHCVKGATVYFHAVKHFSMDYFHNYIKPSCRMPCAKIMGNPRFPMNSTRSVAVMIK